jgi:hypothetical protein
VLVFNLCYSLRIKDKVLHACKTTGKMTTPYILIIAFLGMRGKEKRISAQW